MPMEGIFSLKEKSGGDDFVKTDLFKGHFRGSLKIIGF